MNVERWFMLSALPPIPGGLNTVLATFNPERSGGRGALTVSAPPEGLTTRAATLAQRPGTQTVTIAPPDVSFASVRLAAVFAKHLVAVRASGPLRNASALTSPEPIEVPSGYVRLPHLVTVIDAEFGIEDRTVWELMPTAHVAAWLGEPLPGQEFFEEHLDVLTQLRRLVRGNALPDTPASHRLTTILRDHYLSIRFVYLHAELIREVLGEIKEHM